VCACVGCRILCGAGTVRCTFRVLAYGGSQEGAGELAFMS
jgi:hypothetical protein